MALKTGSLMFSVTELFELNFGILSFFTILEKKLFKVSAVSDSDASIFSFSVRFIFSPGTDFNLDTDSDWKLTACNSIEQRYSVTYLLFCTHNLSQSWGLNNYV